MDENVFSKIGRVLDQVGIDPSKVDCTVVSTDSAAGPMVVMRIWHPDEYCNEVEAKERREAIRLFKQVFGKFAETGEPPYVSLEVVLERDGIRLKAVIHGAFKCEVTGYREEAVAAIAAKPAEVKQVPAYSCEPVRPKPVDEPEKWNPQDVSPPPVSWERVLPED